MFGYSKVSSRASNLYGRSSSCACRQGPAASKKVCYVFNALETASSSPSLFQKQSGLGIQIQSAEELEIGSAVKIDGICFEITGEGEENENIQEDFYDDCDACSGVSIYRAEPCGGGDIIDLGPVDVEIDQIIKIGDICYTVLDELGVSEEPIAYETTN